MTARLSEGWERGFVELEGSRAAPRAVATLRELVRSGPDEELYKLNAFRFAEQAGVTRIEAVRTLLFATRLGLFDLSWDIHCPSCTGLVQYHRHLMGLQKRAHCGLCELDWSLSLEEQVEVSFTINPGVRQIDAEAFVEASWPEARPALLRRLVREGRVPQLMIAFDGQGRGEARGAVAPGDYAYQIPGHPEGGGVLRVRGAITDEPRTLALAVRPDGKIDPPKLEIAPGPVHVTATSAFPKPDWGLHFRPTGVSAHNWVSAAYIAALQDFRDLFADELLAADASFAVRSITLMFSDIRGSTEMYEGLGDVRAYALVQEHFRLMTEVIRAHEGGIVKTIGDAVMAAFPVNADAVRAALEIQERFSRSTSPLDTVEVKLGLHRGPVIAVTSNRALDYFGRTVNIAARIQGASAPREVLLSEAAFDDEARRIAAAGWQAEPLELNLKGIAGLMRGHRLRHAD
jgi:class 3 adenylate cyclase